MECRQMINIVRNPVKISMAGISAAVLGLAIASGLPSGARADEASAKQLIKAMSDYLAAQKAISFSYDSSLEVVTSDKQKLALTSSGAVVLNRPDKVRVTRRGG